MKISEMIEALDAIKEKHGDLEVTSDIDDGYGVCYPEPSIDFLLTGDAERKSDGLVHDNCHLSYWRRDKVEDEWIKEKVCRIS